LSLVLIVLASMVSGCAVVDVVKSDIAERQAEPAYASRDYAKAAQAYREMADVGNPYGQYALSLLYLEGKGVRQDQAESLRWMEKAAESGYPAANFSLGLRHLQGKSGLKKDPKAAVAFFEKAAASEDEVSMFYLGMLHAKGLGVAPNATEALRWFRMAKALGYPVPDQLLSAPGVASYMQKGARVAPAFRVAAPVQEDRETLTRAVQRELAIKGYAVGVADGAMGPRTKSAIEAYQQSKKLPVDGQASQALLDALRQGN
jgi:localization factor PodJL